MDGQALLTAISAETDITLEIPEVTTFTGAELSLRDKNKYNEGKTAGVEILIKDLKETHGVEVDGKDPNKFIDALKAKTLKDASIEPNKQLADAQEVIEKLKGNLQAVEIERDTAIDNLRSASLKSKMTAGVEGEFILSHERILNLMQAEGYSLDEDNGAVVFKQDGKVVRDEKTQDAMPASKVFQSFASASNLTKESEPPRTGRGTQSSKGAKGGPTSLSQLEEQWRAEGKSPNSAEFLARAQELAKDNPEFLKN